jgi:hypothetical protein
VLGAGVDDCGEPRLGERLGALGYTHVIIRKDTLLGSWLARNPARFAASAGLTPGMGFRTAWILSVNAVRPRVHLENWSGFYPREYEADRTWRWMAGLGTLRFLAMGGQSDATLEMEMRSFPADRRVEWFVDGRRGGEIEVTAEWGHYQLRLGPLERGRFELTLACVEPAVAARDVLPNHDPRALGLAVGPWTFKDADR